MNDLARPLVSVVIPTYNHARYLGRALQSVLDQTYTNWEVIVIDNHSTDNTDGVMTSFKDPRITYLKIHNNGVIAASRNAGIRVAKGEWIAFLDSDDWWTNDKLDVCSQNFSSDFDLLYHPLQIIGNTKRIKRKITTCRVLSKPVIIDLLIHGNGFANSSVLVRKWLLDEINGIDENVQIVGCEDYDTWLRSAKVTEKYLRINKTLGFYQIHETNVSLKDIFISEYYVILKHIDLLSPLQSSQRISVMEYCWGRKKFREHKYCDAIDNLKYSFRFGTFFVKLKSFYMLIVIFWKMYLGFK